MDITIMKTLTINNETYEIVDENSRSRLITLESAQNQVEENLMNILGNNNEVISNESVAFGKNNFSGLKGYYWFNLNLENKTFTLSSTQMEETVPESIPYAVGDIISLSDESNAFTDCSKIEEIYTAVDTNDGKTKLYVRVDVLPNIADIRSTLPEDWEHLYVCDFAVWCLKKPNVGAADIGIGSQVSGINNTAIGTATFACGYLTNAIGPFSSASGLRTTASGERSHAEGSDTIAAASCAHAEGYQSQALAPYAHAEGSKTEVRGDAGHAEGYQTKALGRGAHSEGRVTEAKGPESHTEGWHTVANGDCQHVEGQYNIEDDGTNTKTQFKQGKYIHIAGNGVKDKPSNAYTLDWNGNAWFAGDVTVGKNGYKLVNERETVGQIGSYHSDASLWNYGEIFNDYEHNKATISAHAEGSYTKASGYNSHAEGHYTEAYGGSSHAEGRETRAEGSHSHAEGYNTKALDSYAHAEGGSTQAEGEAAHAEGYASKAIGQNAHAEGRATQAIGGKSHTEGWNTIASEECQHVQGKYNEVDSSGSAGNYAHIIGNGTSATKRSNAHTVDWDGNAWYAGEISAAGASMRGNINMLSGVLIINSNMYGDALPNDAKTGQIFFKKK